MKTTVVLTTSLASSEQLGDQHPDGIILNRLPQSNAESSVFDFSRLNIVATVDLTKTSLRSAVSYFVDNITYFPGEHYMDLAGKRIPISECDRIYDEVEKIDRHYNAQVKGK